MPIELGQIEAIYRYPVKSMRGQQLDAATLGWYGIEGDRRLAFRRIQERGGNPWLSASRLPELISYTPIQQQDNHDALPTHVRTPEGEEMPLFGDVLAEQVGRSIGTPVQMTQLRHGIFDETSISIISAATVREIGKIAENSADVRRFRPNILVRTTRDVPFEEDEWVGSILAFGQADDAPAVAVMMRDLRCSMVNIDPDSANKSHGVMQACVRANENHAGIYCTATRTGQLAVGQTIVLRK